MLPNMESCFSSTLEVWTFAGAALVGEAGLAEIGAAAFVTGFGAIGAAFCCGVAGLEAWAGVAGFIGAAFAGIAAFVGAGVVLVGDGAAADF